MKKAPDFRVLLLYTINLYIKEKRDKLNAYLVMAGE